MFVIGSRDCIFKVWNVLKGVLVRDLLGYEDEVYVVDWVLRDGVKVVFGGKDKVVRIWMN